LVTPQGRRVPIEKCAAPIRERQGEVVGAVIVFRDITKRVAVERKLADALEHERNVAATLQRSLLLSTPDIDFPGFTIETIYEPAVSDLEVGGDFLDAYALDGARIALVVGDVSGKGLVAAARTAEIKRISKPRGRNNQAQSILDRRAPA
jgi:serine phosphatase RsbU (regulator of sigma subunit)